jgi:hypothetical protein
MNFVLYSYVITTYIKTTSLQKFLNIFKKPIDFSRYRDIIKSWRGGDKNEVNTKDSEVPVQKAQTRSTQQKYQACLEQSTLVPH